MRLPTAIAANAALIRKATRLRFGTAMAMSIAQLANFTLPKQFVYLDKGNRQDEPRKDNKYNLAPSTRKISLWHANQEVTGHSRRSWCM